MGGASRARAVAGTRWGLLRHYWVAIKLLMNVVVVIILVMHLETRAATS